MIEAIRQLARQGSLEWMSFHFAEFVARRSPGEADPLVILGAALVCEANQRGSACVNLAEFADRAAFAGGNSAFDHSVNAEWPGRLRHSPLIGAAQFIARRAPGKADPLLILGAALGFEATRSDSTGIQPPGITDSERLENGAAGFEYLSTADWLDRLRRSPLVGMAGDRRPLILDRERLYLHRYWWYECRVADRLLAQLELAAPPGSTQNLDIDAAVTAGSPLDDDQRQSVLRAAGRQFSVISGGPGSGKTSTVVRILSVLLQQDPDTRIALAAPTGKAAARMLDSIERQLAGADALRAQLPDEATTLHRLLGYRRHRFNFDAEQTLPFDCVVVDEASMIDLQLMHHLLDALAPATRLILLGDRDQLASVAAGNVLGDITGHGLPVTDNTPPIGNALSLLRHNYRFARDSAIASLAMQVNQGDSTGAEGLLRSGDGLVWQRDSGASAGAQILEPVLGDCEAVFASADPATALAAFDRSQLLCAVNFGPRGVFALNRSISETLLTRKGLAPTEYFHGLPLMIQRNNYELGLFNGDTGILWDDGSGLRAWFRDSADGLRDIALNRLPEHLPAWAISVHKSQGSEFDRVLLLLPEDDSAEVLTRELLYTAITRARHEFRLLASPEVLRHTVGRLTRRHSGLAVRLGWPESTLA